MNSSAMRNLKKAGLVLILVSALVFVTTRFSDIEKWGAVIMETVDASGGVITPEEYAGRYKYSNLNAKFGTIRSIDKNGVVLSPEGTFKWAEKVVVFKDFKEGMKEARFVDKENLAAVLPPGLVVIAYPQKGDPLIRAVEFVTGGGWTHSTTPDPKRPKIDTQFVPSMSNTKLPGPAR